MSVDRYRVNDALGALANEFGIELDDDTLNELTHHVADVLETATDSTCGKCVSGLDPSHRHYG